MITYHLVNTEHIVVIITVVIVTSDVDDRVLSRLLVEHACYVIDKAWLRTLR